MAFQTVSNRRPALAEWYLVLTVGLLIVALASVPYLMAYAVPSDHVFAGVLLNPVDGNTYFAKMRQGLRGDWLFTLPYTAEPGPGVFLFTYYLFLGHLSRWTGASLDLVYHTARILGGLALLVAAYAIVARFFDTRRSRLVVWMFYALGSGLGWLAVPLGGFPPDLWVAEAIPFLSVFANPHFGLATALLLLLVLLTVPGLAAPSPGWPRLAAVGLLTTLLALVLPIALLNVGLLLAGVFVWWLATHRPVTWARWVPTWSAGAVFSIAALPWVIHAYSLTITHPVLAQWNAQNLTPSPSLWETALAGGALLLLAVPGAWKSIRTRAPQDILVLLWLGSGVLALYAPFALQRRLALGLWMPLALLAGTGLRGVVWPQLPTRWRPWLAASLALALLPSNILVLAATLSAVAARDPAIFMSSDQAQGMAWLQMHAGRALVSAPPTIGLWIPARTDARVIYGHPFETANAESARSRLEAFYAGTVDGQQLVEAEGVRYVWAETEGAALWLPPAAQTWPVLFRAGGVVIYGP